MREELQSEGFFLPAEDHLEDERDDRDECICHYFQNAFHLLMDYQRRQWTEAQLRMSVRALCLALGFREAAGANSATELARKMNMSRQCVNKAVNHFVRALRLGPLPTQRDECARENMKRARKEQIGNHEK